MTTPYGSDPQQPADDDPPAAPAVGGAQPPSAPDAGVAGNQPPYGQQPYGEPPYGQQPYGQPSPYGQSPYGAPGGFGPPPTDRRRTGLIVGAIVLAVLVIVAVVVALSLGGDNNKATGDTPRTPATGQQSSPNGSAGSTPRPSTPPAIARPYCAKLKTIDRDPRLLSINTRDPADVTYAIHKFLELGNAAPPVIHADWARVNLAIERGLHGQTAPVTQSQLQQSFDNIKSEAQVDCRYTLRGGPFG
jgi:hypothetical protein